MKAKLEEIEIINPLCCACKYRYTCRFGKEIVKEEENVKDEDYSPPCEDCKLKKSCMFWRKGNK